MDGGFWLQGSVGYEGDKGLHNEDRTWMSHIFGSGHEDLGNDWRAGFDAELTSNSTYLRRYDISNKDRLTNDIFVDQVWTAAAASPPRDIFSRACGPPIFPGKFRWPCRFWNTPIFPITRSSTGGSSWTEISSAFYRTKGEDTMRATLAGD